MTALGMSSGFHSSDVWCTGHLHMAAKQLGKEGPCRPPGTWGLSLPSGNIQIGYSLCNCTVSEVWLRRGWRCGCMSTLPSCTPREGILDAFDKKSLKGALLSQMAHFLGHLRAYLPTCPSQSLPAALTSLLTPSASLCSLL